MRSLMLLGCVLVATACEVLAPEDATTVRIVSATVPATRRDPVLMRIQNIGIDGAFRMRGYSGRDTSVFSVLAPEVIEEVCSSIPASINANSTINTELRGCGVNVLEWIVIETIEEGSSTWTRTACHEVTWESCPRELRSER